MSIAIAKRQTQTPNARCQTPNPNTDTNHTQPPRHQPLRFVAEVVLNGNAVRSRVIYRVCISYMAYGYGHGPLCALRSASANKRRAQKTQSCCYSTQQQQNQWVMGRVLRPATAMITHWNILCFPHPCRGRCFATIAIV